MSIYIIISLIALIIGLILIVYKQHLKIIKFKNKGSLLKKVSEFKEQTSNMIVHDLKVPLATLINIELISDEKTRMMMVKQASKRMMLLVQNVLDTYKYENTDIKLRKEAIDMHIIINDVLNDFKLMAQIKNLNFNLECNGDCIIIGDTHLLHRVISNLLSNSIKFSPVNGLININLESKYKEFTVSISNDGPGIPKDKQTLIFNRFEQAQIQNFGKLPSTGLGLNFCKLIIDAHKGRIGVQSDTNKGAKFWLNLPQK